LLDAVGIPRTWPRGRRWNMRCNWPSGRKSAKIARPFLTGGVASAPSKFAKARLQPGLRVKLIWWRRPLPQFAADGLSRPGIRFPTRDSHWLDLQNLALECFIRFLGLCNSWCSGTVPHRPCGTCLKSPAPFVSRFASSIAGQAGAACIPMVEACQNTTRFACSKIGLCGIGLASRVPTARRCTT